MQLAVEDFGTGYSSLAYLQQFPVHVMKVDRSFIGRLDGAAPQDQARAAIVRAVVSLAAGLDLRTVAEGIETPATRRRHRPWLRPRTGLLLGRPVSSEDFPLAVRGGVVLPAAHTVAAASYRPTDLRGRTRT